MERPDAMSGGATADPTGLSEGEQQLTPEAEGMIFGGTSIVGNPNGYDVCGIYTITNNVQ